MTRFAIAAELEKQRGYRRVRADFSAYAGDLEHSTPPIDVARDTILAALHDYFTRAGIDANWDVIRRLPDAMLVVSLSMLCRFAPAENRLCWKPRMKRRGP